MPSSNPFPLIPPRATALRLAHFDDYIYKADPTTRLFKYVDALCGVTGAGSLVNEIFMARLQGALATIYFNDLDYIMSSVGGAGVGFLARSASESYNYTPTTDMLTAPQWNEVAVKDAWYRARIREYFVACGLGGTPEGLRQCIVAALSVDASVYETWRYIDNFGLTESMGRCPTQNAWAAYYLPTGYTNFFATPEEATTFIAGQDPASSWIVQEIQARNEVTIVPHKTTISPVELRLARDMLARMCPVDTIITVNLTGLAVLTPVPVAAACADSSYFEVQKMVTGTPALDSLPPPELLGEDLIATEQWLFNSRVKDADGNVTVTPQLAPSAAFNMSQESSIYYLAGGSGSPIDSVTYGTLRPDGTVQREQNFEVFNTTNAYTDWISYEKADSPDNFPGGKWGQHPAHAPAVNNDGTPYIFAWTTQGDFIAVQIERITALGGLADTTHYKMPIQRTVQNKFVFYSDFAIASFPPAKESTVTKSLTYRRQKGAPREIRNPSTFAR